jgi:hypothetical protein
MVTLQETLGKDGLNPDRATTSFTDWGDYCGAMPHALRNVRSTTSISTLRSCAPADSTAEQLGLVTLKYLHEHPEELHKPASDLIVKAVRAAFPCPKK